MKAPFEVGKNVPKATATVTPNEDSIHSSPIKSSIENIEEIESDLKPKGKSKQVNICDIKPWLRVDL